MTTPRLVALPLPDDNEAYRQFVRWFDERALVIDVRKPLVAPCIDAATYAYAQGRAVDTTAHCEFYELVEDDIILAFDSWYGKHHPTYDETRYLDQRNDLLALLVNACEQLTEHFGYFPRGLAHGEEFFQIKRLTEDEVHVLLHRNPYDQSHIHPMGLRAGG